MIAAQSQCSSFLPEAIVFNILTRLPVKSLCQFKCVCKTLFSIISTPLFVNSHAAHSKSQPKLLVAIYRNQSRYLFIGDPMQDKAGSSLVALRQSITMLVKRCLLARREISPGDSQSVGGLMLSLCSQDMLKIGNPSTNKCVAFSPRLNYYPSGLDKASRYVSLGFDPVEGKHKFLESLSVWGRSVGSRENRAPCSYSR